MGLTKKNITSFLVSFKSWFFLSFLVIVIIGLSLFFLQEDKLFKNLENLHYVEEMEVLFSQWQGSTPAEKVTLEEELNDKFSLIKDLSFSGETLARALFIQGKYELFVLDKKEDALVAFNAISSKQYQYPLALLFRGFIHEEQGEWLEALAVYEKLASQGDDYFKAQGVFHQAIVREKLGELDLAISLYASLVENFPTFMWGQLAQNRLVYLELLQN